MKHHTQDKICPLCFEKLAEVHPALVQCFVWLKDSFPEVHIAWGFRNEEEQNKCYAEGKTKAQWPHSLHNACHSDLPKSRALDLFELTEDNRALFIPSWYGQLAAHFKLHGKPIEWAGNWTSFREQDHFQLSKDIV